MGPVIGIPVATALFVSLPIIVILYAAGGRGIFVAWLLFTAAIGTWLLWTFVIPPVDLSTGMEGIALFVMLTIATIAGFVAWIWYLIFSAFGWLPKQRKSRDIGE